MAPRIGVVVFPGTNCEHDVVAAAELAGARRAALAPRRHARLGRRRGAAGGFAHGDYLRPGRAGPLLPGHGGGRATSPAGGGPVVGICNGFQVLTEAGLLPGALQKNGRLRFLCEPARVRGDLDGVGADRAARTVGDELVIPINHFSGNYTCDADTLRTLQDEERIVLRYADNPNGSLDAIAGIANEAGNVVGLMPHPERASAALLGSTDGLVLLRSLVAAAGARAAAA